MKFRNQELTLEVDDEVVDGELECRCTEVMRWGSWYLIVSDEFIGLENDKSYFIEGSRFHEEDWERHMASKNWVFIEEFMEALTFCRTVTPDERKSLIRRVKTWRNARRKLGLDRVPADEW